MTELYTTDGEIAQYDLLVLEDDRHFFPAYEAVWLYRADLEKRHAGKSWRSSAGSKGGSPRRTCSG